MYCYNCGKEIDDKAVICIYCGVATGQNQIANNDGYEMQKKNWLVTVLLCFFLGWAGGHRFYTGHTGTAIIQLILSCSCVGSIISLPWAFIDLIVIICGNFKTKDGKYVVNS